MSNELMTTTTGQVAIFEGTAQQALIEIRKDSRTYPRLSTYPREQAVAEMCKIVAQAYIYRGQQADATTIKTTSGFLVDELQADTDGLGTKYITFAEISRVVKRAVLSSDMYGISVASLYRVIVDYVKGEGHRIEVEARKARDAERQKAFNDSAIAPMLQVYAGRMMRGDK